MPSLLSLTLVDDYGRTTKRVVEMKDQTTIALYQTSVDAFITALAAVTELGVVRADVIRLGMGTPSAAETGSNVDVGATISGFLAAGNGKKASLKIPHIKPGLVEADGTIDLTDVAVAAYLALFESAADFYLSDGEQVATWIKGVLDR